MRKIIIKGDTYFLIEDSDANTISIGGSEVYDVSDMTKKEFQELRENPSKARAKIKILRQKV